jgi:hypothetical protein
MLRGSSFYWTDEDSWDNLIQVYMEILRSVKCKHNWGSNVNVIVAISIPNNKEAKFQANFFSSIHLVGPFSFNYRTMKIFFYLDSYIYNPCLYRNPNLNRNPSFPHIICLYLPPSASSEFFFQFRFEFLFQFSFCPFGLSRKNDFCCNSYIYI